jgi:hypothetical protein
MLVHVRWRAAIDPAGASSFKPTGAGQWWLVVLDEQNAAFMGAPD